MAVGMGQRKPEEMPDILAACDRAAAGPTAPAKGLMLDGNGISGLKMENP